jgi:hypothetical protein
MGMRPYWYSQDPSGMQRMSWDTNCSPIVVRGMCPTQCKCGWTARAQAFGHGEQRADEPPDPHGTFKSSARCPLL